MNRLNVAPDHRFFLILDGITLAFLGLELWHILSGILQTIRYGYFHWACFSSFLMTLLLCFPICMLLTLSLLILNAYALWRKLQFRLHRVFIYRRSFNAPLIQLSLFACTAVSYWAALEFIACF